MRFLFLFILSLNIAHAKIIESRNFTNGKPKALLEHFELDNHYRLTVWGRTGNKTISEWRLGSPTQLIVDLKTRNKELRIIYRNARMGTPDFDLKKVRTHLRPLSEFVFDQRVIIEDKGKYHLHTTADRNKGRQFVRTDQIKIPKNL